MKQTRFHALHVEANAKMVEFAGFHMPIQYPTGILEEHRKVRTGVGMFDVSHMGEFFIGGPDALALVQKLTTNDASKLEKPIYFRSIRLTPDGVMVPAASFAAPHQCARYRFPDARKHWVSEYKVY